MSRHSVRDFDNAKQLLSYLLEDREFQPDSIFDATGRGVNGMIFRGQADTAKALLPTAHRAASTFSDYVPQAPEDFTPESWAAVNELGKRWQLVRWLHAEVRAVQLFLEQADKLGLATPINYQALTAHQRTLDALMHGDGDVAEYLKHPYPVPEFLPGVSMAQHYGVPTRFLDWTESPLVAAYFAVFRRSPALHGYQASADERVGIYVLNTHGLRNAINDAVQLAFAPRHINVNLRVQRGLFTYIPIANKQFLENGRWPSLEDALAIYSGTRYLNLLTLPATESDAMLRLLWRYDVTRHHMLPSLREAASAVEYSTKLFGRPSITSSES